MAITLDFDTAMRQVTQITHPALSSITFIDRHQHNYSNTYYVTVELYSASSSGSSGQLTITFNGTTYFKSVYTIQASGLGNVVGVAKGQHAGTTQSFQMTPTGSGATHGLVIYHANTDQTTSISPWSDQTLQLNIATYRRSRVSTRQGTNLGGTVITCGVVSGAALGAGMAVIWADPVSSSAAFMLRRIL